MRTKTSRSLRTCLGIALLAMFMALGSGGCSSSNSSSNSGISGSGK